MSRKTRQKAAGPFCAFPPNARFPIWYNSQWTWLTMRPGDTLAMFQGRLTDEGFAREHGQYEYDRSEAMVYFSGFECGRDCDGPWEHSSEAECPVDELHALEPAEEYRGSDAIPARPRWMSKGSSQRDHFAEAAGY